MPKPSKQSTKLPKANLSSTARTKVEGKMNSSDAGTVGKMYAIAYIIAATAFPMMAVAAIAYALK